MVAGHERFGTHQGVEQFQAFLKVLVGPDVAAEKQQVGFVFFQMLQQQASSVIAKAIVPVMQIGGDGNAHADIIAACGVASMLLLRRKRRKKAGPMSALLMTPARKECLGEKIGPPTIPSLPNGPEVLFFSPKVEDKQK
jgi:hypothetical protein